MAELNKPERHKPRRRKLPILVRHAVTLAIVFALAVPLSYVVGKRIYRHQRLSQLDATDQAEFERALAFVEDHVADDPVVFDRMIDRMHTLDAARATQLMAISARGITKKRYVSSAFAEAAADLIVRVEIDQALTVYLYAQRYVFADHEAIHQALASHLSAEDEAQFVLVQEHLDANLLWSRQNVPDEAWLRWVLMQANSDEELAQSISVSLLRDLGAFCNDPRVVSAAEQLTQSTSREVRLQALNLCAGFAGIADLPYDYLEALFSLGHDDDTEVARRAWLTIALLGEQVESHWEGLPFDVAQARMWAAVRNDPSQHRQVLPALDDPEYAPAAVIALEQLTRQHEYTQLLTGRRYPIESQGIAEWRRIIACHISLQLGGQSDAPGMQAYQQWNDNQAWEQHAALMLAARFRLGNHIDFEHPESPYAAQLELAGLEGSDWQSRHGLPVPLKDSAFVQRGEYHSLTAVLLAVDHASTVDASILMRGLTSDQPTIRDLACAVAFSRKDDFDVESLCRDLLASMSTKNQSTGALLSGMCRVYPKLIQSVTAAFLREHPDLLTSDLRAMNDAELEALGLHRVDALTELLDLAEHSSDPSGEMRSLAQLLRLGLWMRGDIADDFAPKADAMLRDPRLETSHILTALLYMERPTALHYLFSGEQLDMTQLFDLFIEKRWWHVFDRLGPSGELDLWLWGDPAAQAFQFEVMQQWYEVNRLRSVDD